MVNDWFAALGCEPDGLDLLLADLAPTSFKDLRNLSQIPVQSQWPERQIPGLLRSLLGFFALALRFLHELVFLAHLVESGSPGWELLAAWGLGVGHRAQCFPEGELFVTKVGKPPQE